tara:strand:- start:162 stop:437 length:276 start_codon:yes stop_codon:yes gene_type:complete
MIRTGDLVQFSNFVVARELTRPFAGDYIAEVGTIGVVTSCRSLECDVVALGLTPEISSHEVELEVLVGDTVLFGIDPKNVTVINHGEDNDK